MRINCSIICVKNVFIKPIIACNIFILLYINMIGQNYIPYPESNVRWKVVHYAPAPQYYTKHYDYFPGGDTIIHDTSYIKLMMHYIGVFCSQDTSENYYVGSYRNDIPNKRVYFRPYALLQEEQLLYDFSLEVGDTVPLTYPNYLYPDLIVSQIDTVVMEGVTRKRFTYWNPPDPANLDFYVYEGIGADWGPIEIYRLGENPYYLRCFHQNDTLRYIDPQDTSCILETDTCIYAGLDTRKYLDAEFIKVFYTDDQIVLELEKYLDNLNINVFDLTGRRLYQEEINATLARFSIEHIVPGLYILTVQNHSKIFITKKIFINH
jgi:hypothetical protein